MPKTTEKRWMVYYKTNKADEWKLLCGKGFHTEDEAITDCDVHHTPQNGIAPEGENDGLC